MSVYLNEFEPFAADWLGNLFPDAVIDRRSICDVSPNDLAGHRRCHFFAGIAGWELALRLAGWPDDVPVWTGSCPCQPFSSAGKQKGIEDERHLWPAFFRLIDACRPPFVFGEQVASSEVVGTQLEASFVAAVQRGDTERANAIADKLAKQYEKRDPGCDLAELAPRWIDGVRADLETAGYEFWFAVPGAHSILAPHIRQRGYWGAVSREWLSESSGNSQRGLGGNIDREAESAAETSIGRSDGGSAFRRCADGVGILNSDINGCSSRGASTEATRHRDSADSAGGWLQHSESDGRDARGAESGGRGVASGCCGMGDSNGCGRRTQGDGQQQTGGVDWSGAWSDYTIAEFRDGKRRRVGRGVQPLAHGVPLGMGRPRTILEGMGYRPNDIRKMLRRPRSILALASRNRTGRLKGYGNAIVPDVAAMFIRAFVEAIDPIGSGSR